MTTLLWLLWAGQVPPPAESRIVTIAAVCLEEGAARDRAAVMASLRAAAARGTPDLVVLPLTPAITFRNADTELADVRSVAREHRVHVAAAFREEGEPPFLTSVLIGRDGRILGTYRKTHALPDDAIALGDELPVIRTDFGLVGLTLGTDFYFPEIYGVLRRKGAELILWQHAPERLREHAQWMPLLKARALDNKVHLVAAMHADRRPYLTNHHGMGMQGSPWGRSMVLSRVGVPLSDTGHAAGVALARLELDRRKEGHLGEDTFFVPNNGGRKAFAALAAPTKDSAPPAFAKRTARIAVAHLDGRGIWRDGQEPEAVFRILDAAEAANADLVLLPEMQVRAETERTRDVAARIGERARRMRAYVLIGGLPGQAHGGSHARLWDRDGREAFEAPIYWPRGHSEFKTFDTDFARIGVHLCGDLHLWEVDRLLALAGAEILFDPSLIWGPDGVANTDLARARAIDNGVWFALSRWNTSDPGQRSLVVDPYGQVLAASPYQGEGVVFADVDFARRKVFFAGPGPDRRPRNWIADYATGDLPGIHAGAREMIFARRRPELYAALADPEGGR